MIAGSADEAVGIVISSLPNFSEESIRGTWATFKPEMKLSNVLLTNLEREGQWLKDNDIYAEDFPNFKNMIYIDYLKEINPESVTLY
jgi:hypothetical protein